MPVTTLSDNREFQSSTVEEADKKFREMAQLEIKIKARAAAGDKRIAAIKAKVLADNEADTADHKELLEWMDKYILANKDRFVKPRKRKTAFGTYGLMTQTKLNISDDVAVITFSDKHNLALYETTRKVTSKAVEQALAAGSKIPGAKFITGDVVKCKVDTKLLNAACK